VQPGVAPLTGVTFPSTGDIGRAGGLTYTFSGLTGLMSQFQTLEWGPAAPNSVQLSMNGPITGPANTLTFNLGASDLANGKAVWTGTAQYPVAQPPQTTISLQTRFTMTARDANNAPITGFNATGYGDGATATVLGNFSANLLFEVSPDGTT